MALTKIPAGLLDKSSHVDFADNERLRLGNNQDLQIYSDGTHSRIYESGSGLLIIRAGNFNINNADGSQSYITMSDGGATTLYNAGAAKLATASGGVNVTGDLGVTGDLNITGNVNSASVTDLDVTDKTITVGAGQAESASGGSGIIVGGSSASILWDEAKTSFDINSNLEVSTDTNLSFSSDTDNTITFGASGTNKPCIRFDTADTTHSNRVWAIENGAGSRLNFFRNGLDVLKLNQDGGVEIPGKIGIGITPTHKLQVLSTDNKGFYLERNTGNEPANLNEFSSYYSLSIKNRAGGSFLNFGGSAAHTSLQATDGAGSATAKNIILNPYGGNVGIGTTATDGMLTIKKTGSNIFGDSGITIQSADTNQSTLALGLTGSVAYVDSTESGSGTVLPLVFATGSSEKMRIDASGRVTFGPDAADIQIDPASTNSGINLLYFRGNALHDKAEISLNHYGHHNYHIGAGLVADGKFSIGTSQTADSFVMDTSGRVMIGTTTEGRAGEGADMLTIGDISNHSGLTMRSGASGYGSIYFSDGTSGVDEYRGYVQYGHNTDVMHFGANGSIIMNLKSSGVAIGSNFTPSSILHVKGTASRTCIIERTAGSQAVNLAEMLTHQALTIQNKASGGYLNFAGDASASVIQAQSNSSTAEDIILNPYGGRVGIGTTSPGAKLEISGKDDEGASDLLRLKFDNSPADTGITFTDINSTVKSRITIDSSNTNDLYISSGTEMKFFLGTTGTSTTQVMHLKKINSTVNTCHVGYGVIGPSGDITVRAQGAGENWRWGSNVSNSHSYWLNSSNVGMYMVSGQNYWTAHSDERLKENITPLGTVLPSLKNMRCVKFNRKGSSITQIGFIAQDWEGKGFDEVVSEDTGFTIQDDGKLKSVVESDNTSTVKPKSMAYTETIPLLLKAIQELEARITILEG